MTDDKQTRSSQLDPDVNAQQNESTSGQAVDLPGESLNDEANVKRPDHIVTISPADDESNTLQVATRIGSALSHQNIQIDMSASPLNCKSGISRDAYQKTITGRTRMMVIDSCHWVGKCLTVGNRSQPISDSGRRYEQGNCGQEAPPVIVSSHQIGHVQKLEKEIIDTIIRKNDNVWHNNGQFYCVECEMIPDVISTRPTVVDEYGNNGSVEMQCPTCHLKTTKSFVCCPNAARSQVRIWNVADLTRGDHIAWHTCSGHWHHAIFVKTMDRDAENENKRLSTKTYLSSSCTCNLYSTVVHKHLTDVDFSKDDVFRIDYEDCFSNAYVMRRARQLEHNGCLNFSRWATCADVAVWCKTGQSGKSVSGKIADYVFSIESDAVIPLTVMSIFSIHGSLKPIAATVGSWLVIDGVDIDSRMTELVLQLAILLMLVLTVTRSLILSVKTEQKETDFDDNLAKRDDGDTCRKGSHNGIQSSGRSACWKPPEANDKDVKRRTARVVARGLFTVLLPCIAFIAFDLYFDLCEKPHRERATAMQSPHENLTCLFHYNFRYHFSSNVFSFCCLDVWLQRVVEFASIIVMAPISYLIGIVVGQLVDYIARFRCCN